MKTCLSAQSLASSALLIASCLTSVHAAPASSKTSSALPAATTSPSLLSAINPKHYEVPGTHFSVGLQGEPPYGPAVSGAAMSYALEQALLRINIQPYTTPIQGWRYTDPNGCWFAIDRAPFRQYNLWTTVETAIDGLRDIMGGTEDDQGIGYKATTFIVGGQLGFIFLGSNGCGAYSAPSNTSIALFNELIAQNTTLPSTLNLTPVAQLTATS